MILRFCLALVLILFVSVSGTLSAQSLSKEKIQYFEQVEDSLTSLAQTLLQDTIVTNRIQADEQIKALLTNSLKDASSFSYRFPALRGVSVQYPQDSTFRIFTWQLYVSENDYRYGGLLQLNAASKYGQKVFSLDDLSAEVPLPEYEGMSPDYWYGAVYYNIKAGGTKKNRHYLLFGYDGYELFKRRKLIDVLVFKENGPLFGAPVFEHGPGKVKNRIVREYSAEVGTRLNYDEALEMIMFDHLIAQNGPHGEGLTYYPDGSYEAYKLNRKGKWEHVEKVFDQVSEEAPRPEPILDQRKKDIFGRGNK